MATTLSFSPAVYSQTYDFLNFTVENGLSQSQVLCLFQSNNGELWLGTNQGGINRYNGSSFSYLNKSTGLSDNVVYSIAQDEQGRVMVGTNNGLNIIDGSAIDTMGIEDGLSHKGVVSIHVADNGKIWLGTGSGVCLLVGDTIIVFDQDSLLSKSTIVNIREGDEGSLWFCTVQNGVFRWNGIDILHINTDDGLKRDYVFDIMPMWEDEAWVYGYDGLYHVRGEKIKRIDSIPVPENTIFYGYQRDKAGNIWIGTSSGVVKYDHESYTLLTTENGLVNDNIWKIIEDREGNIWFGSKSNGVSKLNSERFKLYHPEEWGDYHVNAIFKDHKANIWLGTSKGVVMEEKDGSQTLFEDKDGLSSEVIRDFDQDAAGNIYIATNYGITVYDGKTFISNTAETNALNSCWDVLVDGDTVWVGTKRGPAILVNGKIEQPIGMREFNKDVFNICRRGRDLWFAYDDGLLKYSDNTFVQLTAKDGFFDGRVRSIVLDKDETLWFGTNDGVYSWNGDTLINYSKKDGLLSEAVYSLGFQNDGSLWVGQSKGLSKLTFYKDELEDVLRYAKEQGFLGLECSANSIRIDEDDRVWVGTANGLVVYDPSLDKGVHYKPITRFTSIKLFSQEFSWKLYADSTDKEDLPYNLTLPYDKNHLTFEFSGVSLTAPVSINYSYILEGFEENWSPITNSNVAVYANIPPGTYSFKVRAGFGDELWKNRPETFEFTVNPPFYRTNWFYMLCLAVAMGIAYSYYTIRRANFKITAQKQKIEIQKDVIELKNRQMVDSINYASTIQSAILPSDELWFKFLPDSFILYKPKDIVSGDFYWMENRGDDTYFAAVDCTGHGVPGALMSIVGYNGLNQAVNEHRLKEPNVILNYLSMSVNESLRKNEHDDYVRDGMDIAFCKLNRKKMKLEFAAAFNPLVLVRNGEMQLIKGERISIGSIEVTNRSFVNHIIDVQAGDCIYIYSDGYADQFGGARGKKMKTTLMKQKILEFHHLPMQEQLLKLNEHLTNWQGQHEQVDDICVIGVRV